jgi:putative DNA primase/helicase
MEEFKDEGEDPRNKKIVLREKLQAESSGILGWLVEGCLKWQQEGLNPPEKVIRATLAGRDETLFYAYILGRLIPEKKASVELSDVYADFVCWWLETIGTLPVPKKRIFRKAVRHMLNWTSRKGSGERYFGVTFNPETFPERPQRR